MTTTTIVSRPQQYSTLLRTAQEPLDMTFKNTLAVFIGIGFLYIVYNAYDQIVAGVSLGAQVLFVSVLVLLVGGAVEFGMLYWGRERNRQLRPIDGSYALMTQRLKRDVVLPDGRIVPKGTEIVINPNNGIGVAIIAHPAYGVVEPEPAAGWDQQTEIRRAIQTTHTAQALTVGDGAHVATKGMISVGRGGIANAATGKFLEGAFRPVPKALPGPVAPVASVPVARLALTDALARSTGSRWVVGQSDSGEMAAFDPADHAHAAIIGSTGTGKTTSVGFTLALAALRAGWHVVILDPDGGENWQPFSSHAEWHETERDTFPGQVAAIHRLYESRHGAGGNPRPVLAVVEEYGNLIDQLRRARRSEADAVDGMLDDILQRGRKRRVHLAFIDQTGEHFSESLIGGTKFRAIFQMGPYKGQRFKESGADQLADKGRFLFRRTEYASFDANGSLAGILRQLPAPASARRIINGTATHIPTPPAVDAHGWVGTAAGSSVNGSLGFALEVDPPSPASGELSELAGPTDYQAAAVAFIAACPDCTQTDLLNALSLSKGYAHELWHKYHPAGKNYTIDLGTESGRQALEAIDWQKVKFPT